jgi:acylphosphatase
MGRARLAGVAGWVRNLRDGRVEAVFEGEPDAVRSVIDFCSLGPQWARVDGVEVIEEPAEGLEGFEIR